MARPMPPTPMTTRTFFSTVLSLCRDLLVVCGAHLGRQPSGGVLGGDPPVGEALPDRGARARVDPAEGVACGVARRIQALDDRPVLAQRAGQAVGAHPAARAEVTGHDLDRVVRALVDRAEARV